MANTNEIPRWVWEEPQRLSCPEDWRITERPADGVPPHADGRHVQTILFGRSEHFQNGDRIDEVLRTLCARLRLEHDRWEDQSPFYRAFVESFFSGGDGSAPGWVKIAPSRLSFRKRMASAKANGAHFTTTHKPLLAARHWGHQPFALNGLNLPTTHLRMKGSPGADRKHLKLYKMTIQRLLADDGFGVPIACAEDWIFMGTSASEEHRARNEGRNLTLQAYPAADPLGRMSPLISLCRMTDDRQWIVSRCVSLCPGVGDALDFRSVRHETAFYFRSDLSNAALVARSITPGQSERFTHG